MGALMEYLMRVLHIVNMYVFIGYISEEVNVDSTLELGCMY